MLHSSDIGHTVDKGWLNYISDGLETIGVISFVGMITGENFITGEILTDREREQAGLNTIVNVGVLLATIASAGGGSLAALGLKQGLIEGVKLGAKTLAVDMISGISGLATVNLLEAAGSPEYMAVIAGMGMSFLGGYCGEKYISKVGSISNVTVDNKGVDIGSVDDWLKDMSPEDAARYRQRLDLLESKKLNATKNIEKIDDIVKGTSGNKVTHSESFSNWDDMKEAHKGTVTRFVQENKPKGSPIPKNWFDKGGSLTIDTLSDGTQVWKYTLDGITVPYVPKVINGQTVNVIEFPDSSLYKQDNFNGTFMISEGFTGNRNVDKANALNYLNQTYGITEIPSGYVLHHDLNNGVFQLVREGIHLDFPHYGGNYYNK